MVGDFARDVGSEVYVMITEAVIGQLAFLMQALARDSSHFWRDQSSSDANWLRADRMCFREDSFSSIES